MNLLRTPWLASAGLLVCTAAAQAQMFTDPGFDAQYKARQWAEMDKAAQARLASRSDDRQAVLAAALVSHQPKATADQRRAAMARAEACVQAQPQAADCQFALGSTLGVHAMHEGLMAMAGSIGRVKTALTEAHTLAPAWYPARSGLVGFYVLAPGFMGGSRDKATELARTAPTPEQVRVLQAFLALNVDNKPEQALQALQAHKPGGDSALDEDVREWALEAAFRLLNAEQPAKARPWFERAQREQPQDARTAFGLGRALTETGAPAEGLTWYERARKLDGADVLPLDYRIGVAQQALGRLAEAKAAFQRFVHAGKGAKKALEDARKRLEQLG